jgi:hypothetical protein
MQNNRTAAVVATTTITTNTTISSSSSSSSSRFLKPLILSVPKKTVCHTRYFCQICPKEPRFKYLGALRAHYGVYHFNSQIKSGKVLCSLCGEFYVAHFVSDETEVNNQETNISLLSFQVGAGSSKISRKKGDSYSKICPKCGKLNLSKLKRRNNICKHCTKTLFRKKNVLSTAKNIKTYNREGLQKCGKCNFCCNGRKGLYHHQMSFHKKSSQNLQSPPWVPTQGSSNIPSSSSSSFSRGGGGGGGDGGGGGGDGGGGGGDGSDDDDDDDGDDDDDDDDDDGGDDDDDAEEEEEEDDVAENSPPWMENGEYDKALEDCYKTHEGLILRPHELGRVISVFNFPINNNLTIRTIAKHVRKIYFSQQYTFKINLSFGYILKNIETGEYRYFKAYDNQSIFPKPPLIGNPATLKKFIKWVEEIEVIENLLRQRKNTKYKLVLLCNALYTIYSTKFKIGCNLTLPSYILASKAILALSPNTAPLLKILDYPNLCMFKAITMHLYPEFRVIVKELRILKKEFTNKVLECIRRWFTYIKKTYVPTSFKGVSLQDISKVEKCFEININIFSLLEDFSCISIYRSPKQFSSTMNLNLFENHVSYIRDMQLYSKKFICETCQRQFEKRYNWQLHLNVCGSKLNLHFPGGFFKPNKTIFEELESYNIWVPETDRFYKEFIVFDMEAMLSPINISSKKMKWTQEHKPISVAICSNVENFLVPHCIVNSNLETLVKEMVDYMMEISNQVCEDKFELYQDAFADIDFQIADWMRQNTIREEQVFAQTVMINQLNSLRDRLEKYCAQIPVLGFNSAKYDLNLIKQKVIKTLGLHNSQNDSFIVKKDNSYLTISNDHFKFLDITHFLSPGTSYAKFLKAYDIPARKGFFPYEYLTDEKILEETELPPLGPCWWSSLKQKNLLDDGVNSVEHNYEWLKNIWREEKMKNMKDLLIWYNCLDVGPFVKGVEKLMSFYFKMGVDIFKTAISVPGISRQLVFQEARNEGATFALCDSSNSDLYETLINNIVGGPSIIFTRHHKTDVTYIRQNENFPCKKIIGFDANALYLWAFDQEMPVGHFVRRFAQNKFQGECNLKYSAMYHWMDWLNKSKGLNIQHFKNVGREKRIGPYLVDGFDSQTNTVFQFQGCYYHGHNCHMNICYKETDINLRESRKQNTLRNITYLKSKKYNVEEIYECEFYKMQEKDEDLAQFITTQNPPFYQKFPGRVSEEQILEHVQNGILFGMVEVDIEVPKYWSEVANKPDTELDPFVYFSEMAPLFGNADVSFEDIGEFMQKHLLENDLPTNPRKLLIGVMKAEKMLIATPLLKWYIEQGLKVTKIYQVVEFFPHACFRGFVHKVSQARRAGDIDESKAVLADTMKLIGNSAYGSMIMNKTKHKKITFVEGYTDAAELVNTPDFEKLTEIDNDFYEIQRFKKKISLDLPIQIGYFILQLAKLRMLQFYYDFLCRYIERRHFQFLEMDTDSAYLALARENFVDIIKPTMKEKYRAALEGLCNTEEFKADNDMHWFPRSCCTTHAQYDKRTPGLFKKEFVGDEMIGLCAKTYIVKRGDETKFSCKGINKSRVKSPYSIFKTVLETRKTIEAENAGFQVKQKGIATYTQERKGFSYFYCKRKVMDDGISTLPLDISLTPNKKQKKNFS